MFESSAVYELCFRAKRGLPLPTRRIIKLVLDSALARTQREGGKVIICNYVWMANHAHILVVSQDVSALKDFYGELKKRITDMLKRLLGMEELQLWENKEVRVIRVIDFEKVKNRLAYYFLNPARAGLVESIEHYPGENTWRAFCSVAPSTSAAVVTAARWIRLPSIPRLSSARPTVGEEERLINLIKAENKRVCSFKVQPLACFKVFGVTGAEELEAIRQEIIQTVRKTEQELQEQRSKDKKPVLGAIALLLQPITVDGYKPLKNGRIIYFLSSYAELRAHYLRLYKEFCERCKECYRRACLGERNVEWPPGAFVPPIPPLINPIEFPASA